MCVEIERHQVKVHGRNVRYQASGAGEPLLLIHGLSGSVRWWLPVLPALACEFRVYLIHLPGFGTLRRSTRPLPLEGAASWIEEWSDAVGVDRMHVVGHSMGGYIAVRLAPTFLPVLAADVLRARPCNILRAGLDLQRQDIRQYLGNVQAPTLIVWGERDELVPLSAGKVLQEGISGAKLVVIPGAGHVPMYDRPGEFERVVIQFLLARRVNTFNG